MEAKVLSAGKSQPAELFDVAKLVGAELQLEVVTRCLQLHGGYGFMLEYPIGRAFRDSRIQTIYGGTSEVMKYIIGKDIKKRFAPKK